MVEVWATTGRDSATLRRFPAAGAEERSALLTHLVAGGAEWIHTLATKRAPRQCCTWTLVLC